MKQTTFQSAFALYRQPAALAERLAGCTVAKMKINRENRALTALLTWNGPRASAEELGELSEGLAKAYGLASVELRQREGEAFSLAELDEAFEYLKRTVPAVNGFFADSAAAYEDGRLTVSVAPGGLYMLEKLGAARALEEYIEYCYEERVGVLLDEKREDDGYDFEKARREAIERALKEAEEAARLAPKGPEPQPAKAGKEDRKKFFREKAKPAPKLEEDNILLGRAFGDDPTPMKEITPVSGKLAVAGEAFFIDKKELRGGSLTVVALDMTDKTGSVRVKKIFDSEKYASLLEKLDKGLYLHVRGEVKLDRWENDLVLEPTDIYIGRRLERVDRAEEKRVELHLHTQMSSMDGVSSIDDLAGQAARWGHKAIAVTDHGVAQAFPDAMKAAKKHGIKIIYGTEGYFINNSEDVPVVTGERDEPFDGDFVCFDIETTGTNPANDAITEIAASLVRDGRIVDTFHTYVNPERPIPQFITDLTGITNAMVANAPSQREAVERFLEFAAGRVLVAHNAIFDVSFISRVCEASGMPTGFTSIDTLGMSRILMPHLDRHKLNSVADALKLPKFKHHSAVDDARTLALMFVKLLEMARAEFAIGRASELNEKLNEKRRADSEKNRDARSLPVRHIILLVKNTIGLKNLYYLISEGHLRHMNNRKQPVIPRNLLSKHREGLLVGSACEAGELFSAVTAHAEWRELCKIARYYDFLEVQPIENNAFMLRDGTAADEKQLEEYNKTIIKLGDSLGIPVVATGDVHFKEPEDEIFRRILMAGKGFSDADNQAPLYLRTTDEMLAEFSYLPPKKAFEIVVTNPNRIADLCEAIKPVPEGMFPPEIPGSADELQHIVMGKAYELYGNPLPEKVAKPVERELTSIIKHSFDVMYMTAQKLIKGSNDRGYLVGSRGSVGSSVVAYFAGITEVNSLPPHYRCPSCLHSDFEVTGAAVGPDLPDRDCPRCGTRYQKEGFDIPFETFLGFDGDKAPDIDLNFSGEDQANAHNQVIEMFGEKNVFRAGTIGTIAEKTAYGYVKKYNEERGIIVSKAEENRLTLGCTGVKRTTGQHPGGMIVVPENKSIYDFCAVQHPADDVDSTIVTTHVDYHSIDNNLLKFDILGHDDPTMIRMLEDLTGVRVADIPLDDKDTMSLYSSVEVLGIPEDDIIGETGAVAIPEFGTKFVRQMLIDTHPTTIDELVRISGLSHGTDVWLNNAKDIIKNGYASLNECICCRDDIMIYLISRGLDPKLSFTIMESVRKGKKLKPEWEEEMRKHELPEWYIESCNKIKYMFPKAHAAAYVIMGFRIAWFKVHHPLAFYAAYFTIRAAALDAVVMCAGDDVLVRKIRETEANKDAPAIEQDLAKAYEVAHEFYLRGFSFLPVDLKRSEAKAFTIEDGKLRMPFVALRGLGESAAQSIVEEREKEDFFSVEELISRCKVSRPVADMMLKNGVFGDLPETSQVTLFG